MTNKDEMDDRIRDIFVESLDSAYQFAIESRNIDALGSIANLCAEYIEWGKSTRPVGFNNNRGDEDE